MEGVSELSFNLMARRLTVIHTLDEQAIISAVGSLGMEARLEDANMAGDNESKAHGDQSCLSEWIPLGISGTLAILSEITAWRNGDESALLVIALAVTSIAVGGRATLRKGLISIRSFSLNINFLMTLAVAGAVSIGQWPEAAMVTFLFGAAELIERHSLERARRAIRSLMELTPERATVKCGLEWREMMAADVAVGEIVRVRPGERIPLDGTVVGGESFVNQAPITGESVPVGKRTHDPLFAGTINERGTLEFTVTANKGHTVLDGIIRAVQEAQGEVAPTQRFVDTFSRYYTPLMVGFALLIAVAPPLFLGMQWVDSVYRALVLLVIACPCALVISTPVTVVSGLASAAKRGILIKGGIYLEAGRRLKVVAFDKTGTLTVGHPEVTDIVPLTNRTADECLQIAASLDSPSEHPVASAIVSNWTGRHGHVSHGPTSSMRPLLPVSSFESITGRGVKGVIDGKLYFVGNHRMTEEIGACGDHVEEILEKLEGEGKSAVVLSAEAKALAVIGVADRLRETSVEAITSLHALGLQTVLLTGDNQRTAEAMGESVGIDDIRGDLLPEEKLEVVSELKVKHGYVGMVGDGMNDAPALARADIGFAMGAAGTDTALDTANVALMQDDLRKLPEFIRLSRRTYGVLVQNISFALLTKFVFFVLALSGSATLWMAVFADMGASLLVVANGLSLLVRED